MANPLAFDLTARFRRGANEVYYKPDRSLAFGKAHPAGKEDRPLPKYVFGGARRDNSTPLHHSLLLSKQHCRGLGDIKHHLYGPAWAPKQHVPIEVTRTSLIA